MDRLPGFDAAALETRRRPNTNPILIFRLLINDCDATHRRPIVTNKDPLPAMRSIADYGECADLKRDA